MSKQANNGRIDNIKSSEKRADSATSSASDKVAPASQKPECKDGVCAVSWKPQRTAAA